ncbi:hypothetical protein CEXT_685601 [Caerostris extrusa]|uniref:Uncharacterized protein n=1 Tax=Caerostris extrusa TaxID=172846 RepID=A0AAV4RXI1_CAEEX|nr:hypothetical protein CEXT_685601 [Caerostris extrusa]
MHNNAEIPSVSSLTHDTHCIKGQCSYLSLMRVKCQGNVRNPVPFSAIPVATPNPQTWGGGRGALEAAVSPNENLTPQVTRPNNYVNCIAKIGLIFRLYYSVGQSST